MLIAFGKFCSSTAVGMQAPKLCLADYDALLGFRHANETAVQAMLA